MVVIRSLLPIVRATTRLNSIILPAMKPQISAVTCRPFATSSPICYSTAKEQEKKSSESGPPTKETLLRIDWMLEHVAPEVLKSRIKAFFDVCLNDVQFEDKLFNYKLSQRSQLVSHIAKIKLYYRYLSPYNKVERIGSCIYEGEDVIVLLWRLSTLESSFMSYLPSFLTKKEPKISTIEGALDIHITREGFIYKIVNRKITAADREGARVFGNLKTTQDKIREKEEEKQLRKELNEMLSK